MKPLRTNLTPPFAHSIPFGVYTVGTEWQTPISRLSGFSAKQLFFTLSGKGVFRPTGQHNWNLLQRGTMLYIPDHLSHEYKPSSEEPWHVGYVTFIEKEPGLSRIFGFGHRPSQIVLDDTDRILQLLEQIWSCSGPDYDIWKSSESLFALLVEIKKQADQTKLPASRHEGRPPRYRETVVGLATQFLHDHLHLHFSLSELASYVGYSPKQVVRLFKEVIGTTPLHYLQRVRLQTAAQLLSQRTDMTVKQVAMNVGMEPIYFARMFQRTYGVVPSKFGPRGNADT